MSNVVYIKVYILSLSHFCIKNKLVIFYNIYSISYIPNRKNQRKYFTKSFSISPSIEILLMFILSKDFLRKTSKKPQIDTSY